MSGIAGLFYPDRRPVERRQVEGMVATLAHRGPDASGVWVGDHVGLGHCMLWTTPESLTEQVPFVGRQSGCVITADARIDNREALMRSLGQWGFGDRPVSDSQLILAAYERWGEACVDHLLGDFAFAIWDPGEQRLFCARDHFGVRPFYYYRDDRLFLFASEIKALLIHGDVPRSLNEAKIADFLVGLFPDAVSSFYQSVRRLAPASLLAVGGAGAEPRQYWSLRRPDGPRPAAGDTYVEAFRELLDEAVRCRLRSHAGCGLLLSGGLDSSSLAAVAARVLRDPGPESLTTYTGVYDRLPQCDERSYVQATARSLNIQSRLINVESVGPLTYLNEMFWHQDEPFHGPHLYMVWHVMSIAGGAGQSVLLDGYDGDTVIGYGTGRLAELARAGDWSELAVNLRGLAMGSDQSFAAAFLRYFWRLGLRPRLRRYRMIRRVGHLFRGVRRSSRRDSGLNGNDGLPPWSPPLRREFARSSSVTDRFRDWDHSRPERARTESDRHFRALSENRYAASFETSNKAAAAHGLELRHPFWDKRLVEFCLALPTEHKLGHGWDRLVLRKAVAGALPEQVTWRRGKTDFLPSLKAGLLEVNRSELENRFAQSMSLIADYVDRSAVETLYRRVLSQGSRAAGHDVLALWQAVTLALWFDWRSGNDGTHSHKEVTPSTNRRSCIKNQI